MQTYTGMGMNRKESGVLLLKKPGKMRWTYTDPDGKLFVLDGKYGYFYSPGETEAQKVEEKKLDDLRSPLRFLLGHTELQKELAGLHGSCDGERDVRAGRRAEGAGAARLVAEDHGGRRWDDSVDDD